MALNLRAVSARPMVPGSTPNPLTTSHDTNPYNPITKPNVSRSNSLQNFDFLRKATPAPYDLDEYHHQGTGFSNHGPAYPDRPAPTTGLGIQLAHDEQHHDTNRKLLSHSQPPSGPVRLHSMTAPEGSMRKEKENRRNGNMCSRTGTMKEFFVGDDDKLVRKVLSQIRDKGIPFELLESVEGMYEYLYT